MNRRFALIAGIALCALGIAYADYGVIDKGDWPATWPKELEPLRKQARTLVGPMAENRHFAIWFTKREEFEAAWPHILTIKSKGAQLILARGRNFFLGNDAKAGVVIHCPPLEAKPAKTEGAAETVRFKGGLDATYIELLVDGDVVDLNRIPIPADTPVVDQRFKVTKAE